MGLRVPTHRLEVMAARADAGFVTPIEPFAIDTVWCVFEQRGTYEFMVHPWGAARLLRDGMRVDGKLLPVTVIDEYPMLGAIHVLVQDPDQNREFTPDVRLPEADSEIPTK